MVDAAEMTLQLSLDIPANGPLCGDCRYSEPWRCMLFHAALNVSDAYRNVRCEECLDAEVEG